MGPTATEWLAAYALQLGIEPPSDDECNDILALAGTAAHDSERIAAPIACWLAARAGLDAHAARELALGLVVSERDSSATDGETDSDSRPE